MGWLKKNLGKVVGTATGGLAGGAIGRSFDSKRVADIQKLYVEQNITSENLFQNLTPEQKKDLLLNNPNIYTPEGSQIYDPLTNSVRLNESDFTKAERLRQESLAGQLSGSLNGDFSNNGQAIQDATFRQLFSLLLFERFLQL